MNWQSARPEVVDENAVPNPRSTGRDSAALSIGELGAQTGLSTRTIRYYEELGLLPDVRRRAGGRRVYGASERERLRFIQRLKALGCSLAEIRELDAVHAIGGSTATMLARLDELLARRLGELDTRIAELAGLRAEIERYRDRIAGRLAHSGANEGERP